MSTDKGSVRVNGELLRKKREAKGMSTTQVAAAISVSERTYARIERDGDPRLSELGAICRALDIPMEKMHLLIVVR